jgi:hypothetical protein
MFTSHSTFGVFSLDEHHEKYETLPQKLLLGFTNELQHDDTVEVK